MHSVSAGPSTKTTKERMLRIMISLISELASLTIIMNHEKMTGPDGALVDQIDMCKLLHPIAYILMFAAYLSVCNCITRCRLNEPRMAWKAHLKKIKWARARKTVCSARIRKKINKPNNVPKSQISALRSINRQHFRPGPVYISSN